MIIINSLFITLQLPAFFNIAVCQTTTFICGKVTVVHSLSLLDFKRYKNRFIAVALTFCPPEQLTRIAQRLWALHLSYYSLKNNQMRYLTKRGGEHNRNTAHKTISNCSTVLFCIALFCIVLLLQACISRPPDSCFIHHTEAAFIEGKSGSKTC